MLIRLLLGFHLIFPYSIFSVNFQIFLVATAGVKSTVVVRNQIKALGRTLKLSRYFPRNVVIVLMALLFYLIFIIIKVSMLQRVLNGEANYGRRVFAVSSINQKEGCTEPQDSTVSMLYMEVTLTPF